MPGGMSVGTEAEFGECLYYHSEGCSIEGLLSGRPAYSKARFGLYAHSANLCLVPARTPPSGGRPPFSASTPRDSPSKSGGSQRAVHVRGRAGDSWGLQHTSSPTGQTV